MDFGRPIHLRTEAKIVIEEISPGEHATAASLDAQVRTLGGLTHAVDDLRIEAPGTVKVAPDEAP